MAFDLATAKPVQKVGFDLATAKPVDDVTEDTISGQEPQDDRGSILDSVRRGMAMGWDDELLAGIFAGYGTVMPESMGGLPDRISYGDAYEGIKESINAQTDAFAERNPDTALAAELAGGLGTGGLGLVKVGAKLAPQGSSVLRKIMAGSAIGAVEGGVAGSGYAKEGEVLEDTAIGAAFGAAAGPVLQGAMKVGGAGLKKVKDLINSGRTEEAKELILKLKQGSTDIDVAGKKITDATSPQGTPEFEDATFTQKAAEKLGIGRGEKLVDDPLEQEVLKQGFGKDFVAMLKSANRKDKNKIIEMVKTQKRAQENKLFKMSGKRPSDVPGKTMMERVDHILKVKNQAGREMDDIAKSLKDDVVDYEPAINSFRDKIEKMGIDITDNTPQFRGSDIEGLKSNEKVIKNIFKRMRDTDVNNAYDLHRLKKFIDKNVSYTKKKTGIDGQIEGILKSLRHDINETLKDQFPEYARVNTTYSDTIGAINNLTDSFGGKRLDLNNPNANMKIGQELRKLTSNYGIRPDMFSTINNVEDVAKKYGGKFDDNLMIQSGVVDELNKMFGTIADTSMQGEVAKGVKQGAEALIGGETSMIKAGLDIAGKAADKARNINEKAAYDSIFKLLRN